ncbi:MAG: hypothetical protein RI897_4042 [Verrucomicrobiota bacterium]|jgi:RNA polymerase sigma-70 factor (ECF subfamily)
MIRNLRFTLICRRHCDEIYRYARSILGHAADAEDAVQEVLLRLWHHLGEVRSSKARAWLYRTTRNHCLDVLRRRARVEAVVMIGGGEMEALADGGCGEPDLAVDADSLRRRMDAALQALPHNLRSVFVLYEVNGLRYREIAEHLDIPINSVKVHLLRARKRLQELLRKEKLWMTP